MTNLPASKVTVSLYLAHVVKNDERCSKSKLNGIFYAINWAHAVADLTTPCSNSWLKLCLEGCIRSVARPVVKKEPLTSQMIGSFVERFGSEDSSLADLRITCLIVMAFAGFLRISEVLNLRINQINILNTHCEMFIEKAKTDVMRDGNIVPVARTDNSTYPVKLLERYLFKSKINALSSEFIFRPVVFVNQEKSSF